MKQLDLDKQLLRNRVKAVSNHLNSLPGIGPTSRKEIEIVEGMLEDVEALALKAVSRRRLKA